MGLFINKKKDDSCDLSKHEGSLRAFKDHCSETGYEFGLTTTDNDLFFIIDGYHKGLLRRIVDETVPKSLPFTKDNVVKLYWNDFSFDPEDGDFDTVGIYYASIDIYGNKKPIDIFRYFRKPVTDYEKQYGNWVEITEEKYYARFKVAADREKEKG